MHVAHTGDALELQLEEHEAGLLRQLADETRTLLEAEVPREDPVVARLFPEAYDDPAHAKTYDDMVGGELRREKLRALGEVSESLGPSGATSVRLDDDLTSAWLAWLTDVRLAVGTRLGVTEETMGAEIDPESPDAAAYSVLHWLGWIQESIIERLDPLGGDG
ncbi:MAG: DUF2017 domain-containing protein [Actinomycetota bacterium]|nr:DUF2017 domain-containing protein [Actinomycetota bacterium]